MARFDLMLFEREGRRCGCLRRYHVFLIHKLVSMLFVLLMWIGFDFNTLPGGTRLLRSNLFQPLVNVEVGEY